MEKEIEAKIKTLEEYGTARSDLRRSGSIVKKKILISSQNAINSVTELTGQMNNVVKALEALTNSINDILG